MAQERPAPKTKQQLIALLKEQLETVQDQINTMQDTLEAEKEKRKQLTAQLQEKEKKIQELIENQAKTLGDKVSEGLCSTLQAANKMRADAEAQVRQLAEDNTVINQKIIAKDNNITQARQETFLLAKKLAVLEQKKTDAKRKQENLTDKKQELKKNLESMKKEFQRIQYQSKQLRGHIQNAKKLRLYLNKALEGTVKTGNNPNLQKSRTNNNVDDFWNGGN